jgi:hypothetical protein
VLVDTDEDDEGDCFGCTWTLLAARRETLARPEVQGGEPLTAQPGLRTWTDDYSNLFQILK